MVLFIARIFVRLCGWIASGLTSKEPTMGHLKNRLSSLKKSIEWHRSKEKLSGYMFHLLRTSVCNSSRPNVWIMIWNHSISVSKTNVSHKHFQKQKKRIAEKQKLTTDFASWNSECTSQKLTEQNLLTNTSHTKRMSDTPQKTELILTSSLWHFIYGEAVSIFCSIKMLWGRIRVHSHS